MTESIGNLIQQSVNKAGIGDQVGAAVVCDAFNKILKDVIGDKAEGRAKAMYIKNKTLSIAVMSSAMGQEIKLHEQEILEKLDKTAGKNKVERLRFLV